MPPSEKPRRTRHTISRRKFLQGFGITSIGLAAGGEGLLGAFQASCAVPSEGRILGPGPVPITLHVNGKDRTLTIEPRTTLADALRDEIHLTGTKIGCDRGACGACTVIVGDRTVAACMTLAVSAVGLPIETIEGLSPNGKPHTLQQAFIEHDALQCGFCTSGMVMSCKHLLDHHPNPGPDEIRRATSGNLCRCGTYPKVFEAVRSASKT